MQAENWSVLAEWLLVLFAFVALVFAYLAGRYAKGQLEEARTLREEQAQPNVVVFMDMNKVDWRTIEIVVKNFGQTPAYKVTLDFKPRLRTSPQADDGQPELLDLPGEIPFLAPGQEWRTFWDHGVPRGRTTSLQDENKHDARCRYLDSRGKKHKSRSILDLEVLHRTSMLEEQKLHHLVKAVQFQNEILAKINKSISLFSSRSSGVRAYAGNAADEAARRETELDTTSSAHLDTGAGRPSEGPALSITSEEALREQ
ncbi:hypothetical protein [Lolliginicoccus levis]|uniref:hypothetical protein n=1 Tax=Lolliginicoccus levis TaxID=2919542 RepID=UPI00241D2E33|nr:hypothetical protein [Lolliginicoccus levis]